MPSDRSSCSMESRLADRRRLPRWWVSLTHRIRSSYGLRLVALLRTKVGTVPSLILITVFDRAALAGEGRGLCKVYVQ